MMISGTESATLSVDLITQTCERILTLLVQYRRHSEKGQMTIQCCRTTFPLQFEQIKQFVTANQPIGFVLPGFPCKSPNLRKVLGTLPDLAERLSLRFLQQLCNRIKANYLPGARIVICSDGHVFGDLIRVTDQVIDDYARSLGNMIKEDDLTCIDVFHLEHLYADLNYDQQRDHLIKKWAKPLPEIKKELLRTEENRQLYRGITRFLVEDSLEHAGMSKAAIQRQCRQRALSVIQRSWAWGDVIAHQYPTAIRLSIHPQPVCSAKFGILLIDTPDNWMTPWHVVCVLTKSGYAFMKHHEAKQIGKLVRVGGIPSHYDASIT